MAKKRRKLDQFLSQRRKNQDVVLAEKTELSNRLFRFLLGSALAAFLASLAALGKHAGAPYLLGLGVFFLVWLILGWILLHRLRPSWIDRPGSFNKFLLLILMMVGVQQLVLFMGWSPYLVPVPVFAMIVSMAYGPDASFLAVAGLSSFVGLTSPRLEAPGPVAWADAPWAYPLDAPLALVLLGGGLVSILGVDRVRKQSRPVAVGLVAGAVQAASVWACELMRLGLSFSDLADAALLRRAVEDSGWALACGLISGGFVTSLLPPIERFFEILTERRLLDLADPSSELLTVLRDRAPGTYQHTFGVAQLASNAAEAIGANRLLAEVGAYYHDIGKIFKPEYFVENMGEDKTIHERLRPSMSKMVIISHVKEGMELAHEAGLPQQIIDMIPMHHGTTVVEYFFQKARRETVAEESPADSEYRYPGSKPRFREAGILMLADNVEAIAKTEAEPNPSRFRTLVHDQMLKRLLEGQLDESDLTLSDLRIIEDSFVRTLTTMYHSRIKYPSPEPERPQAVSPGPAEPPASVGGSSRIRK